MNRPYAAACTLPHNMRKNPSDVPNRRDDDCDGVFFLTTDVYLQVDNGGMFFLLLLSFLVY